MSCETSRETEQKMKILEIRETIIPSVKLIKFARFVDHRGYFTEPLRKSQFDAELPFMRGVAIMQANESYSKKGVIRGLHFQWNPFMGKLVRTIHGRMIDLFLDIRKGSPTYGKAAAIELASSPDKEFGEWIWIPPGFAHGNCFLEDTTIEYFCSGEYSPGCEAGISPLAADIDWSLCDPSLKTVFDASAANRELMTTKDINGFSLGAWTADARSGNFSFAELS
jgi:dTDP-4-dehydrorhamnose 3,5-epimerase